MSATPTWLVIASALFFAFDLLVVAFILLKVRRKNQYRGFEVIANPERDAPEARKD